MFLSLKKHFIVCFVSKLANFAKIHIISQKLLNSAVTIGMINAASRQLSKTTFKDRRDSMQTISSEQVSQLKTALSKMRVPREISENLLDPSNVKRTYNAFITNTRFLSRDQWVIDFATLRAEPIEDATDETRAQLMGTSKAEMWKSAASNRLDSAISEGQTEMGNTRRRVKRVSLDIEADDLYTLKAMADKQGTSIGTMIRKAVKRYIQN